MKRFAVISQSLACLARCLKTFTAVVLLLRVITKVLAKADEPVGLGWEGVLWKHVYEKLVIPEA